MRFDVKKTEDTLYGTKFLVQDQDNKSFQFYGTLKAVKPDELTVHICGGPEYGSKTRGTYTFPVGSKFTICKMKLDVDKEEWVYTQDIISWKDIMEMDDNEKKEMKEEKEMNTDNGWKDCVIYGNDWVVNDQIKEGDTIFRIQTDTIDIKGNMTISDTSDGTLSVEFTNSNGYIDTINIDITPDMWVFKSESPKQNERPRIKSNLCTGSTHSQQGYSAILVQHRERKFNPELRVGKLYHVTYSNTGIQYLMHVKSITDNAIDVHIINTVTELDNRSSLTVTDKSYSIAELLEYKFMEA